MAIKIGNWFKREKSAEEKFDAAVEIERKRLEEIRAKGANRKKLINDCILVMNDCKRKFAQSIDTERKLAIKKRNSGIPIDKERDRMQEAAIGILTADMALFDLESVTSEADLNAAMNQMGKALFQLIRLDKSTASISSSSRSFIDVFYPGFKSVVEDGENYTIARKAKAAGEKSESVDLAAIYEIPEEIRRRIDDTFVDNLLAGDSYSMAMLKAQKNPVKKHSEAYIPTDSGDTDWDRINALASEDDDVDIGADSYNKSSK